MPAPALSDRLCALVDPYLARDDTSALAQVPEPLKSLLERYAVPLPKVAELYEMIAGRATEIDAIELMLDDDTSRARLLEFFAAKILGPTRFQMTALARWSAHLGAHGSISVSPEGDGLDLHTLAFEGATLRYLAPFGNAISPFLERQYFLERGPLRVRPDPGDVAMDFGAGAGDTALAFAATVGPKGRVLAVEPTPSELALQARNIAGNPDLAPRIMPVVAAVSDRAGLKVDLAGETTHAHIAETGEAGTATASTTTIDALTEDQRLQRLDFIKLDIEGMELAALQGAQDAVARYRPKLAVCAYHGWQIFEVIPWVRDRLPGYSLHLETHSPIAAETVLYARPR